MKKLVWRAIGDAFIILLLALALKGLSTYFFN